MPDTPTEWLVLTGAISAAVVFLWALYCADSGHPFLGPLRRIGLIKPVPYKRTTRFRPSNGGLVYEPSRDKNNAHRCINDARGLKGDIWICTCRRGYLRRSLAHEGRRGSQRECWWRIRPHRPLLYSRYRRILAGDAKRGLLAELHRDTEAA